MRDEKEIRESKLFSPLSVVRQSKSRLYHFLVFQKLLDISLTQRTLSLSFEPLENASFMKVVRAIWHFKYFEV